MANKKKNKQIDENISRIKQGIFILKQHPLFESFCRGVTFRDVENMEKTEYVLVNGYGGVYVNRKVRLEPEEWAHMLAHASLHLAFGHFDEDKMPGVYVPKGADKDIDYIGSSTQSMSSNNKAANDKESGKRKKVICDRRVWNIACDIYVEKFLESLKIGRNIYNYDFNSFVGSLQDEIKIYNYLMEHQNDIPYGLGTAGNAQDMIGLDKPRVYETSYSINNSFTRQFAYALAASVTKVVEQAGGYDQASGKEYTRSQKAANWFISHYPLLGGIAASFKIIEDYTLCSKDEIMIAAVSPNEGEIYVNPAAGLNDEELKFVMAHEFLHAGLMHGVRAKGRDSYLWNVACDYVINGWLSDMHIGVMPSQGILYDKELDGMSAEEIYDRIVKDLRRYKKLNTLRGYGKGDVVDGGLSGTSNTSAVSLDEFYRNALRGGLEFHISSGRGYIPEGLVEDIRALAVPPIPWDVELAKWFDGHFAPLEKHRTYARPSRRQGSTPDIPRPSYVKADIPEDSRTFGVVIDTSGSMSAKMIGYALGAIASYAVAKEVPYVRVVFCDAAAYDAGYLAPEDIAGRVEVKGRGGTVIQPAVDLLEHAKDFPKDGPILIITDGYIEDDLTVHREHAFLISEGNYLPFRPKGKVFHFDGKEI